MRIEVALKTLTRLHTAAIEKTMNTKKNLTETTTVRLPVENHEGELRHERVPVINANQLRGRIRRLVFQRLKESLRESGKPISVDMIHLLTCLSTSGSPSSARNMTAAMKQVDPQAYMDSKLSDSNKDECSSSNFRLDYIEMATSDPFVALFGGGPNIWKSRLQVSDMLPLLQCIDQDFLPEFSAVHADHLAIAPFQTLGLVGTVNSDDLYKHPDLMVECLDESKAWIALDYGETGKSKKKKKEAGNDDDNVGSKCNLRNMMAFETVHPGITFGGEIFINTKDVQDEVVASAMKGLVLLALQDMNDGNFGGMIRNNWGKVKVDTGIEAQDNSLTEDNCISAAKDYIKNFDPQMMMEAFGVAQR